MIGRKQDQTVGSEGMAIQAGRDVTLVQNTGLSTADVRELCQLLFRENFATLRDEAQKAAQDNVEKFGERLENKLMDRAEDVVLEKLGDPDVQAAINDAVKASARKGESANTETLLDLIAERISSSSTAYKDLVISEAVTIVPKITKPQIQHLSFIHYLTEMSIPNLRTFQQMEALSTAVLMAVDEGMSISRSQRKHLEYAGACSVSDITEVDIYEGWMTQTYSHLGHTDVEEFKSRIVRESSTTKILLDAFDKHCRKGGVSLTSVGQAIAIANLSTKIGKLDYETWLS